MKIFSRSFRILTYALAFLLVAATGAYWYWVEASPQSTCESCHEIESSSAMWARSGHRDFSCKECHGTALGGGIHSLKEKSMMLVHHFTESPAARITLDERQVLEMMDNCRRCHGTEYGRWISGGHSATYGAIFLNAKHNAAEQLNADCLRCHGMFYGGTIDSLVTPVSRKGPWSLRQQGQSAEPVIPCLACHRIHTEGTPGAAAEYDDPGNIFYARKKADPAAAFYDRYERMYLRASALPVLRLREGTREVKVSDDPRARICFQCHAPGAFHQAGSADDRTPRGVHEGLSCLACHDGHSNDARGSCINCHPAISNCRLDVTTMHTSFAEKGSPHNIHFVRCLDCHTKGIPPRRDARAPGRDAG